MTNSHSRVLLTFHHILSAQKKRTIREAAKVHGICGICKVGYPGILAVEGGEEHVNSYVRRIKSLRWASCTLADLTSGLDEKDLHMTISRRAASEPKSIEMVEKMGEVGAYMRRVGLEDWWRKSMGYTKGGPG